jgi:hypothetical protein
MEKKVNIKCTTTYGEKDIKELYIKLIKSKIKEQGK